MPFDNTVLADKLSANPLIALGITPVPLSVVDRHKAKVIKGFIKIGPKTLRLYKSSTRAHFVKHRVVQIGWHHGFFKTTLDIAHHLSDLLPAPYPSAPAPIVDLVRDVQQFIAPKDFELEWFYDDPIINVMVQGTKYCLGIWDANGVVAVTGRDGQPAMLPPEPPPGFFERMWRFIESAYPAFGRDGFRLKTT